MPAFFAKQSPAGKLGDCFAQSARSDKEDGKFVSKCLELGVASQGDTEEEALARIQEASESYLNTLEDLGECERVLREKQVPIHDTRVSVGPPLPRIKGRSAVVRPAVLQVPAACA